MNILAIETATAYCSVALETEDKIFSCFEAQSRQHATQLLPMVDSVLRQGNLSLSQINTIAVSIGPGSFTGLRIGVGVAQGLAFPHRIPIIPVSTLAAIAQGLMRQQSIDNKKVAILLDAHMKEVFYGAYQIKNGLVQVVEQDQLISIDEKIPPNLSLEKEGERKHPPFYKGGQGGFYDFVITDLNIDSFLNAKTILQLNTLQLPSAIDIITLAKKIPIRIDAMQLQPVYLRTETAWKKQNEKINEN